MGYDLALSGLLRKRGELAGEFESVQMKLTSLMADLNALDAAIRVLKPDLQLEDMPEGVPPTPFAGFRGEIQRFIMDELRKADGWLSTFDLAELVMRKRGLDAADRVIFKLVARRTGYALAKLRRRNAVVSRGAGRNAPLEWRLGGSES